MQSNDLISRAAALDAIDHERDLLIEQKRFGAEHVVVHHARRLIEELPAVDAAPVVHGRFAPSLDVEENDLVFCKDCMYYSGDGFGWCECFGHSTSDYWFCTDGEKRGEDE